MEASPSHTPAQPQLIAPSTTFSTGARLFTVGSAEVDEWWPLVADHIQRWLAFDGIWTVDGVKEEIKAARAQLWCVYKDRIICVCVTRVDETDSVRLGLVWGCGGDFMTHKEDSKAFLRVIEGWFRELGCQFVEWSGREGWAKIFTDYKRHAVVLRKRL